MLRDFGFPLASLPIAYLLVTDRSQVLNPAASLHVRTLGKLFTHTCASVYPTKYQAVQTGTSVSWELNRHSTLHNPRVGGLAASAGVWLKAIETEIIAAPWAFVAREGL